MYTYDKGSFSLFEEYLYILMKNNMSEQVVDTLKRSFIDKNEIEWKNLLLPFIEA